MIGSLKKVVLIMIKEEKESIRERDLNKNVLTNFSSFQLDLCTKKE